MGLTIYPVSSKGFEMCSGSHVIMMASDLETDPSDVKNLLLNQLFLQNL